MSNTNNSDNGHESDHDLLITIASQTKNVGQKLNDFIERADKTFVTNERFEPVSKIVYGAVALILTGVFISLIALVVHAK